MLLTELLHADVVDAAGARVGTLIDLRFVVDAPPAGLLAGARLYGLVVSPHGRLSYWGYERNEEVRPAIIASFLRWLHRGSFLVTWDEVEMLQDDGRIRLAPGFVRRSPVLG